jgi:hypothetical protein
MMPVPSHLKGLVVSKDPQFNEENLDAWIRCPCGGDRFVFLYPGTTHECRGHQIPCTAEIDGHWFFVLRVRCTTCAREHLLFDGDFHGWNGYVCHQPEYAARPRPPLVPWRCESCGCEEHRGTVQIATEGSQDFAECAHGLPADSWPDAFGWFAVQIECCRCAFAPDVWVSYETM